MSSVVSPSLCPHSLALNFLSFFSLDSFFFSSFVCNCFVVVSQFSCIAFVGFGIHEPFLVINSTLPRSSDLSLRTCSPPLCRHSIQPTKPSSSSLSSRMPRNTKSQRSRVGVSHSSPSEDHHSNFQARPQVSPLPMFDLPQAQDV